MNDEDMAQVQVHLTALLEAIDAGELTATDVQRAYVQGALDTIVTLRGGGDG